MISDDHAGGVSPTAVLDGHNDLAWAVRKHFGGDLGRVDLAAGVRSDAGDCIHQIKTKAPIVRSQSDSVKRRGCTLAAKRGLSQAESTQRWGTT